MDKNVRKDEKHNNSAADKMVKTKNAYNWPNIAKNKKKWATTEKKGKMENWQKGPTGKNGQNWPNIAKKYQKWQKGYKYCYRV